MIIYPLFGALAQLVAHNTGSVGVRSSNLLCSTWLETLIYKASSHFLLPESLDTISILDFEKCLNTLKYKGYSDQHFSTFWVRILVISEGKSIREMSEIHKRTSGAIRSRLKKLELT